MQINIASAVYPGYTHRRAVELAYEGLSETYGKGSTAKMQLCPQHPSLLDENRAEQLRTDFPETAFRLHANVRVEPEFKIVDASTPWESSQEYFRALARVNHVLGSEPYTLHAGRATTADLDTMAENVRRVEDTLGVPVGVEGLYPDPKTPWLINSWRDYAWLLESGLRFAIDLSHLNIVAHRSGERHDDLVRELVASEMCCEIHVSANHGDRDQHLPVNGREWWWDMKDSFNPGADLFTEGQQRKPKPPAHEHRGQADA